MAFASDKGRQGAAGVSTGGYSIDNSLRFNDDDSAYLSRTPSSAGNRKTWTWSGWLKFGNIKTADYPKVIAWGTGGTELSFYFNGNNLQVYEWSSGAYQFNLVTDAIYRDPSAWYHLVVAFDTTQSTASNRIKIYINGSQVTSFSTETYPSEDFNTLLNSSTVMQLGVQSGAGDYYDGYLAEVHFIDGQALDHTSFGETGTYGEWKPIEVTGMTYGTNGFYLDFGNTGDKHTITVQGDVQHTTSPKKIGDSSIHFLHNGGTADILKLSSYPSDLVFSGDFTYEFWAYKDDTSSSGAVFGNNESGYGVPCQWRMMSTGNMSIHMNGSSTWSMASGFGTSTSYTASVWQHWALVRSGSTITLYRDGVSQATTTSSQAQTLQGSSTFVIGGSQGSDYYNGHLDEIRISNTARYTSGFTPSTTAFTDDANTMLLIHSDTTVFESTTFTDDSGVVGGLGTDASSNTNNWTVNNLAATDQMLDSPTNNFCTLNPIFKASANGTLAEGNLKRTNATSWALNASTMSMSTGKWYAEFLLVDNVDANAGIWRSDIWNASGTYYSANENYRYDSNGGTLNGTSGVIATYTDYDGGDILGLAYDGDNGKFYVAINNTWVNSANPASGTNAIVTGLTGKEFYFGCDANSGNSIFNFGQDSSFAGNKTAQGNQDSNSIGDFYYTPPTDFLALCTSNLPDPAVVPSEHFNTVLYTGNNSTQVITGVGFQPDFVWFKTRASASSHQLADSVRGVSKLLRSSSTAAESTGTDITSFDSDGYTLAAENQTGSINGSAESIVAWNWKAGGTGVSNTSGSITSTVSANADAGFSIVSYTGDGNNGATFGHGLSSTPEIVFIKNRISVQNWVAWGGGSSALFGRMLLNTTNGNLTSYNATFSSSLVTMPDYDQSWNGNTNNMIAYCFHSVDGYSKVGSYTGNGSADGTFVYTSFKPKYVMIRATGLAENWLIFDTPRSIHNVTDDYLMANRSNAESVNDTDVKIDVLSNGFKIRGTNAGVCQSGANYIFLAFADVPFKYSTGV